jgi:hypothetical protein
MKKTKKKKTKIEEEQHVCLDTLVCIKEFEETRKSSSSAGGRHTHTHTHTGTHREIEKPTNLAHTRTHTQRFFDAGP